VADNERPQDSEVPQAPPVATRKQAASPWPGRIAGIVVIISILAIGLAVFLPKEQDQGTPQAGQTMAENPQAPNSQAQTGSQASNQQSQWQPNQQKLDWQSPQAQTPAQMQQWQTSAQRQTQQSVQQPTPAPTQTQAPYQAEQAATQQTQDQGAVAPTPAPTQPAPAPAPSPAPQPTTAPAPQPSPQSRNPINQRQASRLVQQAETTERYQRNQAIDVFIGMLRQPQYQDPENWGLLAAGFATMGQGMIPGGPTSGTAEITSMITNSRNGAEAAARLERQKATSALPSGVQRQLVRVIAQARDYQDCVNGLDQALRQSGTQLSDSTVAQLKNNIAQAWNQGGQIRQQYGR